MKRSLIFFPLVPPPFAPSILVIARSLKVQVLRCMQIFRDKSPFSDSRSLSSYSVARRVGRVSRRDSLCRRPMKGDEWSTKEFTHACTRLC